ncbi:MAG: hypothetical protein ACI4OY_07745, partial [Aristaeellaceae bacterium]
MIRQLYQPEKKQAVARAILEALPEWFGIPEAREDYIRRSAAQPCFAAYASFSFFFPMRRRLLRFFSVSSWMPSST